MSFDFEKNFPYILSIIMFFIGMLVQNYRIKNNNIREKARELDEGIMKELKIRANKVKNQLDEEDYIFFGERITVGLNLNNYEFSDILEISSIFKVKDGKISLIYQKDGILRKHAKIIIQNLENYQSEVSRLKNMLENFNESNIPPNFKENLNDLLKDEFGESCLETEKRLNEFLFKSYIVSISGSKNSLKSGRSCIVNIIRNRYNDLQYIARNDSESNITFLIIQNRLTNIISCQNKLINEIEELHEEWLNKHII